MLLYAGSWSARLWDRCAYLSAVSNLYLYILQTTHTLSAPQTNLQLDILMGRDELIEPADVFLGMIPFNVPKISTLS